MVGELGIIGQIKSCINNKNNFIIDAGAGSGKTFSLIQTIEAILQEQINNHQKVLCVTFTNVAKNEINDRLSLNTDKIIVSTLHDFIWDFIKQFQINLQLEVENLATKKVQRIKDEIQEAQRKIDNPTRNTNIDKQMRIIENNEKRLLKYKDIDYKNLEITYDVYSGYHKGKISHDDIISIMSNFLEDEFFSKLLLSTYPYILIDEYQDTDWDVIKKLLLATSKFKKEFPTIVGMFGDKMQMIYEDVEFNFDSLDLVQIKKEDNYRTAIEIVEANNKFRNDGLVQNCNNQYPKVIFGNLLFVYNRSQDYNLNKFINDDVAFSTYKRLYLANKNIAYEIGFTEISDVFNSVFNKDANDKLFKLKDQFISYVINGIVDKIVMFENKNYYDLIQNINFVSVESLNDLLSKLTNLITMKDQSLIKYIDFFINNKLIDYKRYEEIISSYDGFDNGFISRMKDIDINQYKKLSLQINNQTTLDTLHGVKGNEFDNVIVNIFENQSWNKYDFDNLFLFKNMTDKRVMRARKLLYVACTRAKSNLIVNYIADANSKIDLPNLEICVKKHFGHNMIFKTMD
ncbi:ATP-dependent DNA helicase pcrA [Acholeplasma oculi]|uniref:DNA helicase II n=1 Tax=Acholeplasma oculi TaxID=35623 RepID=A0A061A8W1_9MOLU|nr:ATP-dependent helicase [Acholeplasma oculi]CDR30278.1 DNA helicase II [Acholeplasma oculi]SKC43377.1 DNA helicase-2 / ATP-dependent DNA helicase PcrA [Acholeplasma oculi]SUT88710.1 ATP-dependent DNA helicase pcrA [Acholeplasma oculi]